MAQLFFLLLLGMFIAGIVLIATKKEVALGKILTNLAVVVGIAVTALFGALLVAFESVRANVYVIFILISALFAVAVLSCLIWGGIKKKYIYISFICIFAVLAVSFGSYQGYVIYEDHLPTLSEGDDLLSQYVPYGQNSKVATLNRESSLKFNSGIPRLDGATALYPVYSAFARAVYPEEILRENYQVRANPYLKCTTTSTAYENLIAGTVDIIFVASPSEKQEQAAKSNGVDLVFTPIGKEAFVFFVNAKNPIDTLSLEQIQDIYSGKITDWKELGTNLGEIKAFQRDEGSGSQSALQRLMKGKDLAAPQTTEVIDAMAGIIKQTADYKNYKNAIGFSFRFYSTEMVKNSQIKLLSIDGIAPSVENIENNTYPIASAFYAVTRADADENTKQFVKWMLGEQGQSLVAQTGYTPLAQ